MVEVSLTTTLLMFNVSVALPCKLNRVESLIIDPVIMSIPMIRRSAVVAEAIQSMSLMERLASDYSENCTFSILQVFIV